MMTGNNTIKVKRSDDVVWRIIDEEVVVLIPEEAMLHALEGCGSRIWELIEGETTISEIVQSIRTEYEVEPQRAREEITEFIHKLMAMKLVEIVPEANEETSR